MITSSNVPVKVVAGGLGLMGGCSVSNGSKLSHASLYDVYCLPISCNNYIQPLTIVRRERESVEIYLFRWHMFDHSK